MGLTFAYFRRLDGVSVTRNFQHKIYEHYFFAGGQQLLKISKTNYFFAPRSKGGGSIWPFLTLYGQITTISYDQNYSIIDTKIRCN
jgi:pantothenate kinase